MVLVEKESSMMSRAFWVSMYLESQTCLKAVSDALAVACIVFFHWLPFLVRIAWYARVWTWIDQKQNHNYKNKTLLLNGEKKWNKKKFQNNFKALEYFSPLKRKSQKRNFRLLPTQSRACLGKQCPHNSDCS